MNINFVSSVPRNYVVLWVRIDQLNSDQCFEGNYEVSANNNFMIQNTIYLLSYFLKVFYYNYGVMITTPIGKNYPYLPSRLSTSYCFNPCQLPVRIVSMECDHSLLYKYITRRNIKPNVKWWSSFLQIQYRHIYWERDKGMSANCDIHL